MLHVHVGSLPNEVKSPRQLFKARFDTELLMTDWSRYVVRTIDKSEVFDRNVIISPVLGGIPPDMLSTGCKVLLMMKYMGDYVFRASNMGENCWPLLKDICDERDILVTMMSLTGIFKGGGFTEAVIENSGVVCHSALDFCKRFIELGI